MPAERLEQVEVGDPSMHRVKCTWQLCLAVERPQ